MENVRQVVVPIVAEGIHENIFYLYVSFLSHFSIKIVSQKMVILSGLSQKLVTGFFPNSQFYDRRQVPSFRNAPTLAHSLSLSLSLFACFPFFPFEYKYSVSVHLRLLTFEKQKSADLTTTLSHFDTFNTIKV
jgi:hypothetical protein